MKFGFDWPSGFKSIDLLVQEKKLKKSFQDAMATILDF